MCTCASIIIKIQQCAKLSLAHLPAVKQTLKKTSKESTR